MKCVLHLVVHVVTQNLTAADLSLAPGMSKRSKHVPMRYAPGLGVLVAHSFNRATILATLESGIPDRDGSEWAYQLDISSYQSAGFNEVAEITSSALVTSSGSVTSSPSFARPHCV